MTNQPLVTVMLIAMNHEEFIAQSTQSIIDQTYKNIEVVFLDNNSEDKTFEIADEIFKNNGAFYQSMKNSENKGVSENLNIQVTKATGDYLLILSGDDWLEKNAIESKMKFLLKNNLDILYSDGYKFIENKKAIKKLYSSKKKQTILKTIPNYFIHNITENLVYSVGFLSKKEILLQHPFDETIHAEDWDIALRLSKNDFKLGFLDKKLFYYRILQTSLSHNSNKMKQSFIEITNKYLDEIKSDELLLKKYQLRLINFEIQEKKELNSDRKVLLELKKKRAKIKYKNPILFFKISVLLLKKLFSQH